LPGIKCIQTNESKRNAESNVSRIVAANHFDVYTLAHIKKLFRVIEREIYRYVELHTGYAGYFSRAFSREVDCTS